MGLKENFALVMNGGELLARFTAAIWQAAVDIVNEAPATQNHAERIAWAKRAVLVDGKAQHYAAVVMRMAVCENGTLQAQGNDVADSDIQFIVNSYVAKLVQAAA
jgi:hypothetical protein